MARMIDADALIRAMGIYTYMETEWTPATAWGVPIVDAEPVKHGHWVFSPKDAIEMMFTLPKCSECGAESSNSGNYCSNCGAKMDEIEECSIMPKADESTIPKGYIRQPQMRLIDANAISYDQLLNTGNKKHPFEWAVSQSRIDNVPTIDAEPVRHGYWKGKPIAGYSDVRCSQCGDVFMENTGTWNYCPNCGAKMDEVKT